MSVGFALQSQREPHLLYYVKLKSSLFFAFYYIFLKKEIFFFKGQISLFSRPVWEWSRALQSILWLDITYLLHLRLGSSPQPRPTSLQLSLGPVDHLLAPSSPQSGLPFQNLGSSPPPIFKTTMNLKRCVVVICILSISVTHIVLFTSPNPEPSLWLLSEKQKLSSSTSVPYLTLCSIYLLVSCYPDFPPLSDFSSSPWALPVVP